MENVIIGSAPEELAKFLKGFGGKIAVLVDENTKRDCLPLMEHTLPPDYILVEIPSGELNKNLNTCTKVWSALTQSTFHRSDLLINLGGGVIGDMGGFCAATYKRGIPFVTIPTTLLAQVDASIGGKLGIDFEGFKNHIGLFQNPARVIVDTAFLRTLDSREVRSGFAEILKHGLITSRPLWDKCIATSESDHNWSELVKYSLAIKSEIVESDFRESGRRKLLNFGHTIGHGIESYFLNSDQPLLHGEAIAIGMVCEAYISKVQGILGEDELIEISKSITTIFGKVELSPDLVEPIIILIRMDKKNKDNTILMTLLEGIGSASVDHIISEKLISDSFEYYSNV